MPSRFTSGAYEPELVSEMSRAFERAWGDFAPRPKNEEFARQLMASAIIETVEAGKRDQDDLARGATLALIKAIKINPDLLNKAPSAPARLARR
jgi:hypothetical protein